MRTLLLFVVLALFTFASAQKKAHRIVVELDSPGQIARTNTINNVENLMKAFGKESCEIEIVCHGAGIDLLFAQNNPLADRMKKLNQDGVQFAACNNTLKRLKISKDRLVPYAKVVDSGTAEVIRKQEEGWSYLKR